VVVEVVAREVREDRDVELEPRGPFLVERVRARLERDAVAAELPVAEEQAVEVRRVGRRVRRRDAASVGEAIARRASTAGRLPAARKR